MRPHAFLFAALTGLLVHASGPAQAAVSALPEGDNGIAARYPGDMGIGRDPDVILFESFEESSVQKVFGRWDMARSKDRMSLAADKAPGSAGSKSLLMTHIGGKGSAVDLYARLKKKGGGYGYDEVYCRMYVKFAEDSFRMHHFGTNIGGNNPATRWPMVSAGKPTPGNKSFWVGAEPYGNRWVWDYYTYWVDMRGSPPRGQTWGNSFIRDPDIKVTRGTWQCIEMMVKVNDVGDTNGELALWVDGKLVSHLGKGFPTGTWTFDKFTPGKKGRGVRWSGGKQAIAGGKPFEGFRWRTVEELNVNYVWAYVYVTKAPVGKESRVWYDQIVVATSYIGPIATKHARAPKKPPTTLTVKRPGDPLADYAGAIAAAEKLARAGEINAAAAAYENIARSLGEAQQAARGRIAVRIEGLAERKRLVALIVRGVAAQGPKNVYVDLFGRGERAKIVEASAEEGTFRIKGSQMPIAWSRVSHRRVAGIAGKYAAHAGEHLAIAKYLAACGESEAVHRSLERALTAGPSEQEAAQARRVAAAIR